jgi:2-polyprenyl-3-methyl-5-hydroxy-6-metoxy-1,4-benzoquinol methylase
MIHTVPISSLCFENRDNVLFWVFLLKFSRLYAVEDFISSCSNDKIKEKTFTKILQVKNSIQKLGQIEPIPTVVVNTKLHPVNGTKRLVAIILLGYKTVKTVTVNYDYIDIPHYSLESTYFENVPAKIIEKYKRWKRLFLRNGLVMHKSLLEEIDTLQPDRGHYSHYQSFNKIGLTGQRPVEERYNVYQLEKIINSNTTVLDLGSNIGCMSIHIAEKAKEVHGVECFPKFVEISNLIKKELVITNCFFHNVKLLDFKTPYEFDVILSLAVHSSSMKTFKTLVKRIYKKMLKRNGYLVFESRSFKIKTPNKQFTNYLKSAGFSLQWTGACQCSNNYTDKENQIRTYHVFKLEMK